VTRDSLRIPRLDDVAPFLPDDRVRKLVEEQAARVRRLQEGLPGASDFRRSQAIVAERATIARLERQAEAADRRAAAEERDAAAWRQAAEEARTRLAGLMRPAYSVNVAARPQPVPANPAPVDDPPSEDSPAEDPPAEPAPAAFVEPSSVEPAPAGPAPAKAKVADGPQVELVRTFFETNPCDGLTASQVREKMRAWVKSNGGNRPVPSPSSIQRARRPR
jgi:hypothetical protein